MKTQSIIPSREKRSLRPLSFALLALGAAAWPGSAAAIDVSAIRFEDPDRNVLDARWSGEGVCRSFGQDELQPALVSLTSPKVKAFYESESFYTEAHLFALDPDAHAQWVRSLPAVEMASDPYASQWWDGTRTPIYSQQVTLPYAVVLPYPNASVAFSGPAELTLGPSKFAGSGVLVGKAAQPGGDGSVQALRMYDHGNCSVEQPLGSILNPINDGFWSNFSKAAYDNILGLETMRYYSNLTPTLEHAYVTEPRDGFFLDLHYQVPALSSDIFASVQYHFVTQDGHVRLRTAPGTKQVTVTNDILNLEADVSDGLETVVSSFAEAIDAQQTQMVLPEFMSRCEPAMVDPCADVAEVLAEAVAQGAIAMNTSHPGSFTPEEILEMRNAVRRRNDHGVLTQWSCHAPEPVLEDTAASPVCKFFVPAKRLNVYPDSLELVWFDDKETSNPAYALYVATHSPLAGSGATDKLCAFKPKHHVDFYPRAYDISHRGVSFYP
jgi:hypothetical protein